MAPQGRLDDDRILHAFVVGRIGWLMGTRSSVRSRSGSWRAIDKERVKYRSAQGEPDALAQRGHAHQGLVALERSGIGSGALMPIEVITTEPHAAGTVRAVSNLRGVHGASAPGGPNWARDGRVIVDVFPHGDSSAPVDRVVAAVHRVPPSAGVGGVTAQNDDFISAA